MWPKTQDKKQTQRPMIVIYLHFSGQTILIQQEAFFLFYQFLIFLMIMLKVKIVDIMVSV